MNVNFQSVQNKYNDTIRAVGTEIQWLRRVSSGSDAFNTGSSTTYGYGDYITYWITGSILAIIIHQVTEPIIVEAGYRQDDYERIQVRTDSTIAFMDRVIIPSGSGILYTVLPFHEWYEQGVLIYKSAVIRRLTPRSGSEY